MPRLITVAAAQVGAIHKDTPRQEVLNRLLKLLEAAAAQGVQVLVYPEITFTTFFPRYAGLDHAKEELDKWFEVGDITSNPNVEMLVAKAKALHVDICVGYAERTLDDHYYNTCSYVHDGSEVAKYRKVHLPGNREPYPDPELVDQLEKLYFEPGNLGFQAFRAPELAFTSVDGEAVVGMMICNDRRWAESWRCLGLQGVELVCVGYNTSSWAPALFGHAMDADPKEISARAEFQHKLVMQAHSYTNATFSVAAARCGLDDDKYGLIGCSCIVSPEGLILAEAKTIDDELVVTTIDLDEAKSGKQRVFNFGLHRQPQHYGIITAQAGVTVPPRLE